MTLSLSSPTFATASATQTLLICPICEQSLTKSNNPSDKSLACENKHSFDYSKEGYINLLPPQHKKTKDPGDNKTMIHCRRDFLEKGFYEFLIPELNSIVENKQREKESCVFVDSGCGEGYFTDKIEHSLNNNLRFYGMDISKEAIRLAAKRNKSVQWFVASSNNIPIQLRSVDIVLKINAPLNYNNLQSKLSDEAIVISVTPGKNHLNKLREVMYLKPQTHKQEDTPDGFSLLTQNEVETEINICNKQDIKNLFMMTPYYWNASAKVKEIVERLDSLNTSAAFNINIYQRNRNQ